MVELTLLEKVQELEDAYTTWLVCNLWGVDVGQDKRLHNALAQIFDDGPEQGDEPCELERVLIGRA